MEFGCLCFSRKFRWKTSTINNDLSWITSSTWIRLGMWISLKGLWFRFRILIKESYWYFFTYPLINLKFIKWLSSPLRKIKIIRKIIPRVTSNLRYYSRQQNDSIIIPKFRLISCLIAQYNGRRIKWILLITLKCR